MIFRDSKLAAVIGWGFSLSAVCLPGCDERQKGSAAPADVPPAVSPDPTQTRSKPVLVIRSVRQMLNGGTRIGTYVGKRVDLSIVEGRSVGISSKDLREVRKPQKAGESYVYVWAPRVASPRTDLLTIASPVQLSNGFQSASGAVCKASSGYYLALDRIKPFPAWQRLTLPKNATTRPASVER